MSLRRLRLLALAFGIGSLTAGGVAGCAGGPGAESATEDGGAPAAHEAGGPPRVDAGSAGDARDASTSTPPQVTANGGTVYLGQGVRLDGSEGSGPDAAFAWKLKRVPAGSAIGAGDLQGSGGPTLTFRPDRVGDYALTLTATSHGGSRVKSFAVRVVEASVFYNDLAIDLDGGATLGIRVVSTSGADARSIVCAGEPNGAGELLELAFVRSVYASDWWEAPAGLDSRIVYTANPPSTDAGFVSQLWAASSATGCGSPPSKIAERVSPWAGGGQYGVKVSPDGERVAYVTVDEGVATVRSVRFDGAAPHQLAPYLAAPDGSPQPDAGVESVDQSPLRWNGTQVAWANFGLGDGTRFQIVSAADQDDATPSVLLRCNGKLRTFDLLPNGDIIASLQPPVDGGMASAFDLVVLRANAVTKECEVVRNLTTLAAGSVVHAATLSPDSSRVAYIVSDRSLDAGAGRYDTRLAVAPVDGSSPPTLVGGVPSSAGAEPFYGVRKLAPRWVAGGTALTFQIMQSALDAGVPDSDDAPTLAVVSASGGDLRAVAASDAATRHIVSAIGGCSVSHGAGSGAMAFAGLSVLIGLVARRRRDR